MGFIVAAGTFKERMDTSCLLHNFKPLAIKFITSYKKMPAFETTVCTEQPMRTEPSVVKVRDISRNERSFNFYLEFIFGVAGHKTTLLEKNSSIFLIFQAIPKWEPDDQREPLTDFFLTSQLRQKDFLPPSFVVF